MWGEIQHDGAGRSPNTSRVRCLITPSNPSRTARSWCGWKPWLRRWLSLFPTRRFSTVRFHSSARSTRPEAAMCGSNASATATNGDPSVCGDVQADLLPCDDVGVVLGRGELRQHEVPVLVHDDGLGARTTHRRTRIERFLDVRVAVRVTLRSLRHRLEVSHVKHLGHACALAHLDSVAREAKCAHP